MHQTIDVTGLPPHAIRAVETLVDLLREQTGRKTPAHSIFDLLGKAPCLRSSEEIARQIQEERDGWGEP